MYYSTSCCENMTTNVSMALCKCHLSDNLGILERLNVVHHANYKRTSNNAAPKKFVTPK